ncbi:Protein of unknown function [Amycolatopsis xylanica]|uniref:DUF3558 domain-containing protein n=1 Tax=Amycolatopsis xylanica TaxID=589385 RepID=A0A1H2SEW5_9PSEU|nr:Protein of unknown function [Amycolatopsis xylanica]
MAAPLTASPVAGDPCRDLLTAEQVRTQLGSPVTSKRADDPGIGPGCDWVNTATSGHLIINYDTVTHTGLSGTYKNVQPRAEVWRELPLIQGFPAVAHVTPGGGPPDQYCGVTIGLADDLSLEMSIFLSDARKGKTNPCDVGAGVAADVVATLRQKAGG